MCLKGNVHHQAQQVFWLHEPPVEETVAPIVAPKFVVEALRNLNPQEALGEGLPCLQLL
jgi:hypothetical protein